MKKLLSILVMVLCTLGISAQEKEVTTFLGIPVDGTKAEMRQKLIEKGFTYSAQGDYLEGEFNGHDVVVHIITNNNKVYRIMLCDAHGLDEANIKIRFNKLVSQFENNKRYFAHEKQTIPEKEDISYQMAAHDKIYEAVFFQTKKEFLLTEEDAKRFAAETTSRPVWFRIVEDYGKYYILMFYDNKYNEADGEDL